MNTFLIEVAVNLISHVCLNSALTHFYLPFPLKDWLIIPQKVLLKVESRLKHLLKHKWKHYFDQ